MKINLIADIDRTQFMVHDHVIGGQLVHLVQPNHIGAKFTQTNKVFRSSVWDGDGNLVSASFPKFVNWGENPDNFPVPESLKNTNIVTKIDGSTLIVSKWNGNLILRTRGTVNADTLKNGHELSIFRQTILPHLNNLFPNETWDISILFEWVSPENRIILSYGDTPQWYLVGIVNHIDYSLYTQFDLNKFAAELKLLRPETYSFPSITDLIKDVETWKGKEGVVVYSKNDQELHKIKGMWYLALHRMKEFLSSTDKIIDVWYEQGEPAYQKFEEFILNQFDFELWTQIRGDVSNICDGAKEVSKIIDGMTVFMNNTLKQLGTRKLQAERILSSYGITNRASFVFKLLDGKTLTSEDRKKLLYQVLKK